MNKEDFVTIDVAQKLKDNGYDGIINYTFGYIINNCIGKTKGIEPQEKEYKVGDIVHGFSDIQCYGIKDENYINGVIHLYDAQKWLRNKHWNMINIKDDFYDCPLYSYSVFNHKGHVYDKTAENVYSYEETLNEAIRDSLKILFN